MLRLHNTPVESINKNTNLNTKPMNITRRIQAKNIHHTKETEDLYKTCKLDEGEKPKREYTFRWKLLRINLSLSMLSRTRQKD